MSHHRRSFIAASVGLILLATASTRAVAQSGIVGGTVYRDTADHPLNSVEVTVVGADRQTLTNYAGEFRITGLPAGRYAVRFRHLGFAPLVDTVVVADNAPVDREYVMAEQPLALDSVRVTANETPHVSSRYGAFLDRLKNHIGGYFVTDSVLRKNDARKLQDLLTSQIPGLHLYRPDPRLRPTFEYLSSGRNACQGPAFLCTIPECPIALYVDGLPIFIPSGEQNDYPNLETYNTVDYAGVEYYAGGATLPPQYNATTNDCGVLLLWTKERLPLTTEHWFGSITKRK